MSTRESYLEELRQQLEALDEELGAAETALREKQAGGEPADAQLIAAVGDMRRKREALRRDADEVAHADEETWLRLKAEAEQALNNARQLYAKAMLISPPD